MEVPTNPAEELSYEMAFEQLEQVVSALESETLTLQQAIELYERGRQLTRRCSDLLDSAELRIQDLTEER
ncbi:MAG TPA: exodeoxyribonuclease VII small subunit [Anaerolineales bacterium]|nr:exodeoxyribonuclease VII small subunit [Anaerolineales bacterium]